MIYEIARITIDPAQADAFEAAVERCVPLFRRAHGCTAMALERELETPGAYLLRVAWAEVDDHMITFRQSGDFQRWREETGRFFAFSPQVCHVQSLPMGF